MMSNFGGHPVYMQLAQQIFILKIIYFLINILNLVVKIKHVDMKKFSLESS